MQVSTRSDEYLTIGELARLCGVTVRTLRYYEEVDLIGPIARTSGKYRLYNEHSLKRVKAIQALQDLGYSLEEIQLTLGPYSKARTYSKEEQVALTRRSLMQQKDSIETKLGQLQELMRSVSERLDTLDTLCQPCVDQPATKSCQECDDYLEVHE